MGNRWRIRLDIENQLRNVHGDNYSNLVDDFVDEVICKAIAGFRHYIPREKVPFKLWLRTIAYNHVRKWINRCRRDRNLVPLTVEAEDAEGEEGILCATDPLVAHAWMVDQAADPRRPPPLQTPRSDPARHRKSSRRLSYRRCGGSAPKPQSASTRREREEYAIAVLSR